VFASRRLSNIAFLNFFSPLLRSGLLTLVVACAALAWSQTAIADWPKSSAEVDGISSDKLRAMETAVRGGDFKRIGSVLIARHGKLVYEVYFEGDAGTLRDTRFATKGITGALVGIALDEKKLSGVDARILAWLPEHARKLENPDPRKDRITVEDFL
jgi:CubicO group peptidase (beta-lactamase class C family)